MTRGFDTWGEARLLELEALLPDDVGIIGVDEHTAVIIDVAAGTAEVRGNGGMTLRYRDRESVIGSGTSTTLEAMTDALQGASTSASQPTTVIVSTQARTQAPTSSGLERGRPQKR